MGGVEIFQDITELKAMERERANLVSMFAHDMKSPLVGIQGFALRLLKKGETSEPEKRNQVLGDHPPRGGAVGKDHQRLPGFHPHGDPATSS